MDIRYLHDLTKVKITQDDTATNIYSPQRVLFLIGYDFGLLSF